MTEQEWQTATDREQALAHLGARFSSRKQRLFACACCRRYWDWVEDTPAATAVEVAEEYADGYVTVTALRKAAKLAFETADQFYQAYRQTAGLNPYIAHIHASACATAASPPVSRGGSHYPDMAANFAAQTYAYEALGATAPHDDVWRGHKATEVTFQTALLRDIAGNPFRPLVFSPGWLTDTVLQLAQQMYESREFGAMPILADALQDAGCDSADLLDHLRDTQTAHVRGCWALDLVLGKE